MMRYLKSRKIRIIAVLIFVLLGVCVLRFQDSVLAVIVADKMWVHRVNSLKKLKEVHHRGYQGVELDLVFENGNLIVKHDRGDSSELSLYNYIQKVKSSDLFIWLDIKNLSEANRSQICMYIDSVSNCFCWDKERFIIESQQVKNLMVFKEKKYLTSYYLPTDINKKDKAEQQLCLSKIKKLYHIYPTDFLSFDRHDYKIVKEYFPQADMLTWGFYAWGFYSEDPINVRGLFRSVSELMWKLRLLSDEKVHVLLFSYNSEEGNR